MPKFIASEQNIVRLFPVGSHFSFDGNQYMVELCGKPRPSSGECKTDVYVRGRGVDGAVMELKISVKQTNADFLENKMTFARALEIFGNDAHKIIEDCVKSIKDKFLNDYLVCFDRYKKSAAKTIKLGWKFELLNKPAGQKSGFVPLSDEQKIDVFAGINLPEDKRNCRIGEIAIPNSGVANYILEYDGGNITQTECLDKLCPIGDYAKNVSIYFGCKALNYRYASRGCWKWDGDRPLAVYVDWSDNGGKLEGELVFDKPLQICGNAVVERLQTALDTLGITKFEDLRNRLSDTVRNYSNL